MNPQLDFFQADSGDAVPRRPQQVAPRADGRAAGGQPSPEPNSVPEPQTAERAAGASPTLDSAATGPLPMDTSGPHAPGSDVGRMGSKPEQNGTQSNGAKSSPFSAGSAQISKRTLRPGRNGADRRMDQRARRETDGAAEPEGGGKGVASDGEAKCASPDGLLTQASATSAQPQPVPMVARPESRRLESRRPGKHERHRECQKEKRVASRKVTMPERYWDAIEAHPDFDFLHLGGVIAGLIGPYVSKIPLKKSVGEEKGSS